MENNSILLRMERNARTRACIFVPGGFRREGKKTCQESLSEKPSKAQKTFLIFSIIKIRGITFVNQLTKNSAQL